MISFGNEACVILIGHTFGRRPRHCVPILILTMKMIYRLLLVNYICIKTSVIFYLLFTHKLYSNSFY